MATVGENVAGARPDTPEWAEQRSSYIGGSEAYELLNERQYGKGCARALGYRKTQTPEDVGHDRLNRRAISLQGLYKRGHLLEDLAARLYSEETGRNLIRRERLVRHPNHPGAGVHTDRIILAHQATVDGEVITRHTGDAEIKTHGEGPFFHILRDGLPSGHNLQLQWSMWCTGHSWGAFIILGVFGEMPIKHFDVERDPALTAIFARASDNFWDALAHGELPPRLLDATDVRCKVCPWRLTCRGEELDREEYQRLLQERDGKKVLDIVNDDELDQALADRALILSEIEALDDDDDEDPGALQIVTARIKELLGDHEAALVNKRWKVYCAQNTWSGLDVDRLRREQPEMYERYYIAKRPTGRKRLLVYAIEKKETA